MAIANVLTQIAVIMCWNAFAYAVSCPNPHHCDTTEIKYRAFSALNDRYLNSTDHVIHSLPIKDQFDCKRECVSTSGCQSSNHFQPINSSIMMCDLIAGNRWSNASKLIPRMHSTHFWIQVFQACLHFCRTLALLYQMSTPRRLKLDSTARNT